MREGEKDGGVRVSGSHINRMEGYQAELGLLGLRNLGSRHYKRSASENRFTTANTLKRPLS